MNKPIKILILTTFNVNIKSLEIKNCENRFQIYSYFIVKYLSQIENVEVLVHRCCRKGKASIQNIKVPEADHAILVEDGGFRLRPINYVSQLRKYIKGTITSIGLTGVYLGSEDMLFYFYGTLRKNKTYYLDCIYDEDLYSYKKKDGTLNILFNDHCKVPDITRRHEDKTKILMKKLFLFSKKNSSFGINIKKLNKYSINTYNNDGKIIKSVNLTLLDLHEEIGNTHIFFVGHKNMDPLLLSEIAFSNVVICAPDNIVNARTVKGFDIITFTNTIPWNIIFNKINKIDKRKQIINKGMMWKNKVKEIFEVITNIDRYVIKYKSTKDKNSLLSKKFYDDKKIKETQIDDRITKQHINNKKSTSKKKKYIYLQS
jgi:hypothetical protein